MKIIFKIQAVCLILIVLSFTVPSKKTTVLFFGDSITRNGVKPDGYIVKMDSIIKSSNISDSVQLIGGGINGNKVTDLFLRIEKDVLDKHPDVVVIYIGINDVWHKRAYGTGTDLSTFEKFYKIIIEKLKAQNIKVILCTPSVIGERNDQTNELDGDLNLYASSIRKIAVEQSLPLCDLRLGFHDYLKAKNPDNVEKGILTVDRVHLSSSGNLFVAQQLWTEIKKAIK